MFRAQEKQFCREFEEIWQCSPFHPSVTVREFLERFVVGGKFDAESFWEFVALRLPKKPASISAPPVSKRQY